MSRNRKKRFSDLAFPGKGHDRRRLYLAAASFVEGRKVLDAACSTGSGAAFLSSTAAEVVAVNDDLQAIEEAAKRFTSPNLSFLAGGPVKIPVPGEAVFDVVVFFEAIDLLDKAHKTIFFDEAQRLLKPGGILLISASHSANRKRSDGESPHPSLHRRYFADFEALLRSRFRHVDLDGLETVPLRDGDSSHDEEGASFLTLVAVCSDKDTSAHGQTADQLSDRRYFSEGQNSLDNLREELEWSGLAIDTLEDTIEEQRRTINWLAQQRDLFQNVLEEKKAAMNSLQTSLGYKMLTFSYKTLNRLLPPGTGRRGIVKGFFRSAMQAYIKLKPSTRLRKLLVIDCCIPTYDKDAGSLRMDYLLRILGKIGFSVSFLPYDRLLPQPYVGRLMEAGIEMVSDDIGTEEYFRRNGADFDFVILSRPEIAFDLLPLVRAYAINACVIYDTVDLHWVRFERGAAFHDREKNMKMAEEYKRMELLCASCSDITFTVTDEEKKILHRQNLNLRVEIVPTIHETRKKIPGFECRRDLMFIGGFHHTPNTDAMIWFVNEIFPLIARRIEGIRLFVVGSLPPQEVLSLQSDAVEVTGYVKDAETYFDRCRVFVSPLRYGAGMKGKINHSLASGLPVVTTAIGTEGMGLDPGNDLLVAEEPKEFADAVVGLYGNRPLWERLSRRGTRHIEKNFSRKKVKRDLTRLFRSLKHTSPGAGRGARGR